MTEMGLGMRNFRVWASAALVALLLLAPVHQATARGAPDSFADLAARLLPTVVNIEAVQAPADGGHSGTEGPTDKLSNTPTGKNDGRPHETAALGSGFVIDPSGLIVTNNHVVAGAREITVTLNDGENLTATIVGRDDKSDLALLRVATSKPLQSTHFGNSDLARVGDWVMAIGNPFGLGNSVTAGIVSARNRDIAEGPYDDFIQTDAPINRGNSGGPLFDMQGDVVGVASALFSPSGGSVGIGFAIPSNFARMVIGQLRDYGQVRRGWIGVRVAPLTAEIAASLGSQIQGGALVSEAIPGGPAESGGIQSGDVITAIDGKPVADSRALPRLIAGDVAGSTVDVEIFRKGRKQELPIIVAELHE